jgi:protein-S-isoprenylcysteine O-methyltransferase Ste14
MKRVVFFAYGMGCYLLFFATHLFLAGFVGNLFVPKSIDSGPGLSLPWAAGVDGLLLLAFGLQHSLMARPAFKARWTQLVPEPIERSTYMLASCLVLIALMWWWQPLNVVIWDFKHPAAWWLMTLLFVAGWLLVPLVSLAINHFDLFGVRQVWLYLQGQPYTSLPFRTPMPYNQVRHPLYVAWAIAFWATPTMTLGHLLFASLLSAYMVAASWVEERDLVAHFGHLYEDYRRRVPAFIPLPRAGGYSRLPDESQVVTEPVPATGGND